MKNFVKKYVLKWNKAKMCMTALWMLSFLFMTMPELYWAGQAEFIAKFQTLETLFTDMISVLGTIYTLWCIAEWGLAWHESNGAAGGQSFKRIFGGLVVIFSPQILAILA